MSNTLVIGAEEVLLIQDRDSYAASRPIPDGIQIAQQLRAFPTARTVIVTLAEEALPAQYWAQVNGFAKAEVFCPEPEDDDQPDWIKHLHMMERITPPASSLILTGLPLVFEAVMARRYPAVLFSRPGGRIEAQRASWAELHNRVMKRREALVREEEKESNRSFGT